MKDFFRAPPRPAAAHDFLPARAARAAAARVYSPAARAPDPGPSSAARPAGDTVSRALAARMATTTAAEIDAGSSGDRAKKQTMTDLSKMVSRRPLMFEESLEPAIEGMSDEQRFLLDMQGYLLLEGTRPHRAPPLSLCSTVARPDADWLRALPGWAQGRCRRPSSVRRRRARRTTSPPRTPTRASGWPARSGATPRLWKRSASTARSGRR